MPMVMIELVSELQLQFQNRSYSHRVEARKREVDMYFNPIYMVEIHVGLPAPVATAFSSESERREE